MSRHYRVCSALDCPELVSSDARGGRCLEHRRAVERNRGSAASRGYGSRHRKLRASYQRRMNLGERFTCWRCGEPIDPREWHLGHDDEDRTRYRGPEHVACNTATAGRTAVAPGGVPSLPGVPDTYRGGGLEPISLPLNLNEAG